MVVRAIHLEYVKDMSIISFLNALRHFMSRRGQPKVIYSDNAKYFKTAANQISTIEWRFITEYSPWKGGFYERLVKNVKLSLKCLVYNRVVDEDFFQAILCEIESIINKRPLTYVDDDKGEIILRPCLFL